MYNNENNLSVSELYGFLDNKIPRSLSCEWDNDGLMVSGDLSCCVNKILLSLDVSLDTLIYANEHGYNTIISHHPLIFRPIKQLNEINITAKRAIYAIKHNINVLSFHTRLDAAVGGVNDVLCGLLGIDDINNFGPSDEEIGRVGALKHPMPLRDFADVIKKKLSVGSVLITDAKREVFKVAVCGGDGKDFLVPGLYAGADTFVCGRCSYNMSVDARDLNINIIEAGHYFTEAPVLSYLRDIIKAEYPDIDIDYYCSNSTELY